MQQPALKYITPEEYLAMEEAAAYKSEYYRGEIFAMAGASKNHNRINFDLGTSINLALKATNCEVFANEMKLWIKAENIFTYPDLMIVCGKAEFYEGRDDALVNPVVIFEILSDSTKVRDRIEKFDFYRSLPSFQEYILIDQYKIHVEQMYLETRNKWILSEYNEITDVLKLAKVNVQIPLQEIYRRVEFKQNA
jgi:Uma2 family endonuclease